MRVVWADAQVNWDDELRRILLGEGLTCEADDMVEFGGLPGRLAAVHPDLVLIRCNGAAEEALRAIRTAHQITSAPILAAGNPQIPLVREAMRAGAHEFLDVDKFREELSDAIRRIESGKDELSKRGKIISIFSPIGGVGVSTAAINLATALLATAPKSAPEKIALVDLNPPPTDLSSLLDLEPKYTLADVCEQWERLDTKMLAGAMVEHSSGIHVLAQAGCPRGGVIPRCDLNPAALRQVLILLRRMYPLVVVDLAHTLGEEQVEAMRQSNLVGLLARPDVPGLRRVNWALEALVAMGLERERFELILSRCEGRGQVKQAKVEAALHKKVFWAIPENRPLVTQARNEGVPLLRLSSLARINSSFAGFARSVRAHLEGVVA
jgi:pilus assembly protein CpaE